MDSSIKIDQWSWIIKYGEDIVSSLLDILNVKVSDITEIEGESRCM